jgi:hypothetical protein
VSLHHDIIWDGEPAPARHGRPLPTTAVRAYDIRGKAGKEITPDGAYELGLSPATGA